MVFSKPESVASSEGFVSLALFMAGFVLLKLDPQLLRPPPCLAQNETRNERSEINSLEDF